MLAAAYESEEYSRVTVEPELEVSCCDAVRLGDMMRTIDFECQERTVLYTSLEIGC